MIYGLYSSANGIVTNMHAQDVIANNLANAETNGFRRQMVTLLERRAAGLQQPFAPGDRSLDLIGGNQLLMPSSFDYSMGQLENTGSPMDVAVSGEGFLGVRTPQGIHLTRNGAMMLDRAGNLVLANERASRVLNTEREPIALGEGTRVEDVSIGDDGIVNVRGVPVTRIGTFDVPDRTMLRPTGGTLIRAADPTAIRPANAKLQGGFLERSNVEATTELTRLMQAQRQLEANANILRYQDQTLGKLVNEVGKIG